MNKMRKMQTMGKMQVELEHKISKKNHLKLERDDTDELLTAGHLVHLRPCPAAGNLDTAFLETFYVTQSVKKYTLIS